jgi:hypothetical protein
MLYVEVDGTGVPVRASETEGRQGKDGDGRPGPARSSSPGCSPFPASTTTAGRSPTPDPPPTWPPSTARTPSPDQWRPKYLRRGGDHFRQVVALGDGAAWIWGMAGDLYPHATHIVDIYHAREHLHDLAAHLAFITPDPRSGWPRGSKN